MPSVRERRHDLPPAFGQDGPGAIHHRVPGLSPEVRLRPPLPSDRPDAQAAFIFPLHEGRHRRLHHRRAGAVRRGGGLPGLCPHPHLPAQVQGDTGPLRRRPHQGGGREPRLGGGPVRRDVVRAGPHRRLIGWRGSRQDFARQGLRRLPHQQGGVLRGRGLDAAGPRPCGAPAKVDG